MTTRVAKERRTGKRVTVLQDLCFDARGKHRMVDLSERGMFLATNEPYMVNSVLDVRFRLFNDDYEISAQARVVYVLEGLGMGLQFMEILQDDRERIRQFIARF